MKLKKLIEVNDLQCQNIPWINLSLVWLKSDKSTSVILWHPLKRQAVLFISSYQTKVTLFFSSFKEVTLDIGPSFCTPFTYILSGRI